MSEGDVVRVLMAKVGSLRCALPVACIVETMRPLPQHPLKDAPNFVTGTSVIRGQPLPVVDLAKFLGTPSAPPSRLVVVRAGEHRVALAVEAVVSVQDLSANRLAGVPPLLVQAQADAVNALGVLDGELLLVLEAARIVPDDVWSLLAEAGGI